MIRFWHKFNQVVKSNICKEVDTMCNLSQGIVDETLESVVMNMYSSNFSFEQISDITDKSVEEIKNIINEHETAQA